MCVCMYVCKYICMYVMHVCMYSCMNICMYVRTYEYVCTSYACEYICMYYMCTYGQLVYSTAITAIPSNLASMQTDISNRSILLGTTYSNVDLHFPSQVSPTESTLLALTVLTLLSTYTLYSVWRFFYRKVTPNCNTRPNRLYLQIKSSWTVFTNRWIIFQN